MSEGGESRPTDLTDSRRACAGAARDRRSGPRVQERATRGLESCVRTEKERCGDVMRLNRRHCCVAVGEGCIASVEAMRGVYRLIQVDPLAPKDPLRLLELRVMILAA